MTTTKKLIIAVVALSLALVGVVGGTLAWLSATSKTVTNTFTYGTIKIELEETMGDEQTDGSILFSRVLPGAQVAKDPTVTVVEGSEKCYVYVLIDNQLKGSAEYNIMSTWTEVKTTATKTLYRYFEVVDAISAEKKLPVFTQRTFSEELNADNIPGLANKNVIITAYAHQADNTDMATANAAAESWAFTTTP